MLRPEADEFIYLYRDMHLKDPYELERLLLQIGAGEEAALRDLIVYYTPLLGPFVYSFTQSKVQEEEVLQDIFLQVWQLRGSLSTIHNFQGFIYSMARHHALNALRARTREFARRERWQALQTEDVSAAADERLSLLEKAIQQLPPQQQRAWLLSRREGRKHTEIAAEMNISTEAVKKNIQRANAAITAYVLEHAPLLLAGFLLSETFF